MLTLRHCRKTVSATHYKVWEERKSVRRCKGKMAEEKTGERKQSVAHTFWIMFIVQGADKMRPTMEFPPFLFVSKKFRRDKEIETKQTMKCFKAEWIHLGNTAPQKRVVDQKCVSGRNSDTKFDRSRGGKKYEIGENPISSFCNLLYECGVTRLRWPLHEWLDKLDGSFNRQ